MTTATREQQAESVAEKLAPLIAAKLDAAYNKKAWEDEENRIRAIIENGMQDADLRKVVTGTGKAGYTPVKGSINWEDAFRALYLAVDSWIVDFNDDDDGETCVDDLELEVSLINPENFRKPGYDKFEVRPPLKKVPAADPPDDVAAWQASIEQLTKEA